MNDNFNDNNDSNDNDDSDFSPLDNNQEDTNNKDTLEDADTSTPVGESTDTPTEEQTTTPVDEEPANFNQQFNNTQADMNNHMPNFDPNQQGYNPYFNNPNMPNMQRPYIPPIDPRLKQYNAPNMQQNYDNSNFNNVNNGFDQNGFEVNKDTMTQLENQYYATKTFSMIVSFLLFFCVSAFVYYYIQTSNSTPAPYFSSGNSPSMEMAYTPDPIPNDDPNGVLTNNEIHEKVSPSVVGIAVYTRGFGNVLQSEGSGIVMSEDGFIITNYHVIANDSSNPVVKIEIIMYDGTTYEARVIGGDSKTDLAVVKIEAVGLVAAEFGDSAKLKIGDRVAVIGNPSGIAFAGSFTQGCVSALSRSIYMSDLNAEIEYIQTDAAINSGNSGGAFINEYGQVVGISAAKMKVEAGYEGMGFAIPINNAKIVVDSLIEHGYVAGRPRVGIEYKAISSSLAELNSIPVGLRVYTVYDDVDAYKYILPGDIITMFDDVEVYDSETVATALADKRAGETLLVTVYRVDEETGVSDYHEFDIILSESVGEKLAETMY